MSELKPCPFCGSKDVDVITHEFHLQTNTYGVMCLNCEAQTKQFYTNKFTAMRAWNRRVGESDEGD